MRRPRFITSSIVRAPERFVLAGGRWAWIDIPIRYVVFEHPRVGVCLIDTGYTARVTHGPRSLPLSLYAALLRPRFRHDAPRIDPAQIKAILISHLHADHVAGLKDHPQAQLFASGEGLDHYLGGGELKRVRHGVFRELLPDDLRNRATRFETLPQVEAPLGLGPAYDVFGDGEVLAVPLPGHMRGHMGFVWPKLERPLLYAADAQWLARAVMEDRAPGPPARWIMDDPHADVTTRQRIAAFARAGGEVTYCHDPEPLA